MKRRSILFALYSRHLRWLPVRLRSQLHVEVGGFTRLSYSAHEHPQLLGRRSGGTSIGARWYRCPNESTNRYRTAGASPSRVVQTAYSRQAEIVSHRKKMAHKQIRLVNP